MDNNTCVYWGLTEKYLEVQQPLNTLDAADAYMVHLIHLVKFYA